MNLYSINTIKQELSFSPLMYRIKENDFSESLLLNYQDIEHTSSQETITNGNPILSSYPYPTDKHLPPPAADFH